MQGPGEGSAEGAFAPGVIALFGPTGVGKTAVAVALAEELRDRGEDPVAVSADALQVYKGLDVLTGAATAEQRSRLEHRLLGFVPVDRTFSVGQYMPLAHAEVDAALAAGRRPIVLGGTGLYLRAALADLDLRPPPQPGLREQVEARARAEGLAASHAELRARAPATAAELAPTDRTRVLRALELLEGGQAPEARGAQLFSTEVRRPTLMVGLAMEREALYVRIERRVEAMVAGGAPEEVQRAVQAGASVTARKALGFDELLDGDLGAMKRRTRRYAKRQLAWMRKLAEVRVLDATGREPEEIAAEIVTYIAAPVPMTGSSTPFPTAPS